VTTVLFAKMNSWDARCKVQNHCPMPGAWNCENVKHE
jgi:hypothetical protein